MNERDRRIVADRAAGMTLAAIGKRHGISSERVRKVLVAAERDARGEPTIYDNGPYQCPECDHAPYRYPSWLTTHLHYEHRRSYDEARQVMHAMVVAGR